MYIFSLYGDIYNTAFLIMLLYLQFDRLLEGLLFVYLSLYVDIHNTVLFDSIVSLAVLSCQFVLHFI